MSNTPKPTSAPSIEPTSVMQKPDDRPIAISMGDPAGIGPEILLKALCSSERQAIAAIVFGDPGWLMRQARSLGLERRLENDDAIQWVKSCSVPTHLALACASAAGGQCAIASVLAAADSVIRGACRALVTAPLSKEAMHMAGYSYPGHTELLSDLVGQRPVRMMLEHAYLRTVLHSIHLSLRDAIDALCADKLMQTLRIADQALSRLLGRKPALLLAALNPHAGEAGAFGREEIELLSPCVAEAQAQGILIEGPLAADSVFARAWNNPQIDAVIALYHDQGLIPIKLLGMDLGVNITLGLPFVRTSPDHGTAFDIAGKGIAREASLLAALKAADHYSLKQAYEHGAEGASAVQS